MILRPPGSPRTAPLFPYTTLFRSDFARFLIYRGDKAKAIAATPRQMARINFASARTSPTWSAPLRVILPRTTTRLLGIGSFIRSSRVIANGPARDRVPQTPGGGVE